MEILILIVVVLNSLFVMSEIKNGSQRPYLPIVIISAAFCFVFSLLALPNTSRTPSYTDRIISDTVHHDGFNMKFSKPAKATIKVWKSWFLLCPDIVSVDIIQNYAEHQGVSATETADIFVIAK